MNYKDIRKMLIESRQDVENAPFWAWQLNNGKFIFECDKKVVGRDLTSNVYGYLYIDRMEV